jgi:hypothetical protein
MKRTLFIPMAALLLLAACSEDSSNLLAVDGQLAAANGSPHFISNATSCSQEGNNLVCTFKEAGLSAGTVVDIRLTVSANFGYACVNGGGNIPSDPKKTVSGPISATGSFTVPKNGNLVATLTISPPSASSQLSCPGGQTATLISVSYTAPAGIQDLTSGAGISVGGF